MSSTTAATLNPTLAAMLAQLNGPGAATASATPFAMSGNVPSPVSASNVATGSGKAPVSDQILDLFTKMHQAAGSHAQGGGSAGSSSASTTTLSTASTMADPLSKMLSTLDTDEESLLSQSDDNGDNFLDSQNSAMFAAV